MNLQPKDGTKTFCATCKEEIEMGDMIAVSTTKTGMMMLHHMSCPTKKVKKTEASYIIPTYLDPELRKAMSKTTNISELMKELNKLKPKKRKWWQFWRYDK